MNNKLINVVEAMMQMSESLIRLLHAVRNAKLAIDNVLRMQYRAAGCPFGESEEGLLLWREKLAKDFALSQEKAVFSEFPGNVSGHFCSLEEEVQKRIN